LQKKTKANRVAVNIAQVDSRFQRFVFELVVTVTVSVCNSSVRLLWNDPGRIIINISSEVRQLNFPRINEFHS